MNKLGFLSGLISLLFLFLTVVPIGYAGIPLYLFNDEGVMISIFGRIDYPLPGLYNFFNNWFVVSDIVDLLIAIVMWLFPLISCILCFAGSGKHQDMGKKIYLGAFFLQLFTLILLLTDVFFIGELFLSRTYAISEFLSYVQVGFWIYIFNLVIMQLAANTYEEM